ncbi:hypothetical protein KSX_07410 [Ktedonospora formicarum]|uniref:HTH tetR-type domain-containing protein n=2 Tax=Ktedonospora formicarum TaxID=2778364 RepID=A0A8J3HXA5_9CHLR|nr:hypothetical protein KSX_07410 [Ktedonospora formicarum]
MLFEQGYHQMSMDEIASRVGIAKGTLYLHFQRKEDLVAELFAHSLSMFQDIIEKAQTRPGTAKERLVSVLEFMQLCFSDKSIHIVYALDNAEIACILRERFSLPVARIKEGVAALLEDGKRSGEFATALPTSVMVQAFFSLLSPVVYSRLLREDPQLTAEDLSEHLRHIYFQGIAKENREGQS